MKSGLRLHEALRVGAILAVTLFFPVASGHAAPLSMAIMGDSLNLLTPTYDTSWVVQLQNAGAISAHDFAFDGATSADVVSSQLSSVVALAASNQITDSVLIVGGNDAFDQTLLTGGNDPALLGLIVANIEQTVEQIAAANPGVRQVIPNIPDITVTPLIGEFQFTAAEIQSDRAQVMAANAQIEQFALARGIPVLDLFRAIDDLTPRYPWTFGGHTFDTMYASNGFDIQTQPEGLLANMVATAFNLGYGQNLPILSDQQIVSNAGFAPDGNTTFTDVRQFVIVPEPSAITLAVGGALLAVMGTTTRSSRASRAL